MKNKVIQIYNDFILATIHVTHNFTNMLRRWALQLYQDKWVATQLVSFNDVALANVIFFGIYKSVYLKCFTDAIEALWLTQWQCSNKHLPEASHIQRNINRSKCHYVKLCSNYVVWEKGRQSPWPNPFIMFITNRGILRENKVKNTLPSLVFYYLQFRVNGNHHATLKVSHISLNESLIPKQLLYLL